MPGCNKLYKCGSQKIRKQCTFVAGRLKTAVLLQKPWFTAFLSRMSRKTQHTRFEDRILRKLANEDKPQIVPPWFQDGVSLANGVEETHHKLRSVWIFTQAQNFSEDLHFCLVRCQIFIMLWETGVHWVDIVIPWEDPLDQLVPHEGLSKNFPGELMGGSQLLDGLKVK